MSKKQSAASRPGNSPYYPTDYRVGEKTPPKTRQVKPTAPVMKPSEWAGVIIWGFFPVINFIALAAWIKKDNVTINPNRRNFAKAALVISLVFWLVAIAGAALAYFVFNLF